MVNIWRVYTFIWPRNQIYTVASVSTVTGAVFMRRFILFFGTEYSMFTKDSNNVRKQKLISLLILLRIMIQKVVASLS